MRIPTTYVIIPPKKHLFSRESGIYKEETNQVLEMSQRYKKKCPDRPTFLKMPESDQILMVNLLIKVGVQWDVENQKKKKNCANLDKTNSAWKRNSWWVKIQSVVLSLENITLKYILYFD